MHYNQQLDMILRRLIGKTPMRLDYLNFLPDAKVSSEYQIIFFTKASVADRNRGGVKPSDPTSI